MAKKILVVDDDPDLVEAASLILKARQYEVVAAYGGVEGLEKVKTERPDCIVLDVMMPDKDGYAVCKELKADPALRDIPVLLLTAVVSHIATTRYSHQMGLETEADDYIDKPVEPDELVKRIEALLSRTSGKEREVKGNPWPNSDSILVIDDEQIMRDGCTRILSEHGWSVLPAENGSTRSWPRFGNRSRRSISSSWT